MRHKTSRMTKQSRVSNAFFSFIFFSLIVCLFHPTRCFGDVALCSQYIDRFLGIEIIRFGLEFQFMHMILSFFMFVCLISFLYES